MGSAAALIDLHTALPWVAAILPGCGLAAALCVIAVQPPTFAKSPPAQMVHASSLYNTVRQVGAAVGVAALATVPVSRGNTHVAAALPTAAPTAQLAARQYGLLLGFHDAFAAALIALIGVAGALLIHDADAARHPAPRARSSRAAGAGAAGAGGQNGVIARLSA